MSIYMNSINGYIAISEDEKGQPLLFRWEGGNYAAISFPAQDFLGLEDTIGLNDILELGDLRMRVVFIDLESECFGVERIRGM